MIHRGPAILAGGLVACGLAVAGGLKLYASPSSPQQNTSAQSQPAQKSGNSEKSGKSGHAGKTAKTGEQIFQQNCSRCHQAPMSIPPRITGTVIMHMRVRARLTGQEQQLLLKYLAP